MGSKTTWFGGLVILPHTCSIQVSYTALEFTLEFKYHIPSNRSRLNRIVQRHTAIVLLLSRYQNCFVMRLQFIKWNTHSQCIDWMHRTGRRNAQYTYVCSWPYESNVRSPMDQIYFHLWTCGLFEQLQLSWCTFVNYMKCSNNNNIFHRTSCKVPHMLSKGFKSIRKVLTLLLSVESILEEDILCVIPCSAAIQLHGGWVVGFSS